MSKSGKWTQQLTEKLLEKLVEKLLAKLLGSGDLSAAAVPVGMTHVAVAAHCGLARVGGQMNALGVDHMAPHVKPHMTG